MGFRFRRSFKVAPGIRLNLSKRGVGMSLGVRGARVSLGADGKVRRTVGLPGTGLSYTTTSSLNRSSVRQVSSESLSGHVTQLTPTLVQGAGIFEDCVVGEPTYNDALHIITAEHGISVGVLDVVASLTVEDRVVSVHIYGSKVGRLNRESASLGAELCQRLAQASNYPTLRAQIQWDGSQWQVLLDLPASPQ